MVSPGAREVLVASAVLTVLASIAVALRILARRKNAIILGSEDWTIIASLVVLVGCTASNFYAVYTDILGTPFDVMTTKIRDEYSKFLLATLILTHFIFGLIKISVVLFYKRIFFLHPFHLWANASLIAVSTWMVTTFLTFIVYCSTQSKNADHTKFVHGEVVLIMTMNCVDIALDAWILALPMPAIKSLHMRPLKKLAVAGVFLLGGFCFISSGVRLATVNSRFRSHGLTGAQKTRLAETAFIWAYVECGASIITACLPTLGPLFQGSRSPRATMKRVQSSPSTENRRLFSGNKKEEISIDVTLVSSNEIEKGVYEIKTQDTQVTTISGGEKHGIEA